MRTRNGESVAKQWQRKSKWQRGGVKAALAKISGKWRSKAKGGISTSVSMARQRRRIGAAWQRKHQHGGNVKRRQRRYVGAAKLAAAMAATNKAAKYRRAAKIVTLASGEIKQRRAIGINGSSICGGVISNRISGIAAA